MQLFFLELELGPGEEIEIVELNLRKPLGKGRFIVIWVKNSDFKHQILNSQVMGSPDLGREGHSMGVDQMRKVRIIHLSPELH